QVAQVQVRGWDPATGEAVVGESTIDARNANVELEAPLSQSGTFMATRPFATTDEATAVADALAGTIAGTSVEADGIAVGDPALRAGTGVSVALAGYPFEGRYVLTSTRHIFDELGYRTHFVVSGRRDRSLLGLTSVGTT